MHKGVTENRESAWRIVIFLEKAGRREIIQKRDS